MNLLLKNVLIVDPRSSHNGKRKDVHLVDGLIKKIGKNLKPRSTESTDCSSLILSPGWYDIGVYSGAPGHEHREDFQSLAKAATKGGYTGVGHMA